MKISKYSDYEFLYFTWLCAVSLILVSSMLIPYLASFNARAETEIIEAPSEIIHTVVAGDSLNRIADMHKVLLSDLKTWNNITSNTRLHPGDTIVVKQINYESREGLASWYGPNFHGQRMANTEIFNMYDIVVAHRTLPLGRKVRITNLENGKSIVAPVLDRGPYVRDASGQYTREIDLSYGVARELGTIQKGVVMALVEPLDEPLKL